MVRVINQYFTDTAEWEETSARCRDYMMREYEDDKILEPYIRALESSLGIEEAVMIQ